MKRLSLLMCALLPVHALAAPPAPVIPQNQHLATVEYASGGGQTGCGLRATGDTADGLHVDVLLNVFVKDFGGMFGMFKVVVRNAGQPGPGAAKIARAQLETASGLRALIREGLDSPHNDGYMARLEFDNAARLLAEMAQTDFRVLYHRLEGGPEQALLFNSRINPEEAGRLSSCMENLQRAMSGGSGRAL
jgi:hypothetical protein